MARREVVEVEPRIKEYVPYNYDFLKAPAIGFDGHKLTDSWRNMLRRCYNVASSDYKSYGSKGVSVCKRWHQVANYIEDVQKLHGWPSKLANWDVYQLDKDYYSSNQYGPETCVWLSQQENNAYMGEPVLVVDSYGCSSVYLSQVTCSKALGIHSTNIRRAIRSGKAINRGHLAGYRFFDHTPVRPLRYKHE